MDKDKLIRDIKFDLMGAELILCWARDCTQIPKIISRQSESWLKYDLPRIIENIEKLTCSSNG